MALQNHRGYTALSTSAAAQRDPVITSLGPPMACAVHNLCPVHAGTALCRRKKARAMWATRRPSTAAVLASAPPIRAMRCPFPATTSYRRTYMASAVQSAATPTAFPRCSDPRGGALWGLSWHRRRLSHETWL